MIQPSRMVEPEEAYKQREKDPVFLKELKESILENPNAPREPFLLLVKLPAKYEKWPRKKVLALVANDLNIKFFTLGGNHSRKAFEMCYQETSDEIFDMPRAAKIYLNLSNEEAILLGSEHNRIGEIRYEFY
jgi:hypothetical protein